MSLEFRASRAETVGLELELQILDAETLDLVDGIVPLLARFPDRRHVKPEFTQTTVEVVSSPFDEIALLDRQVRGVLHELVEVGRRVGVVFAGAGTHPFSVRAAAVTPDPRYHRIEKEAGVLAHDKITFATHVHVGVPDPAAMMRVFRDFTAALPVLIALSANSPFWREETTGFAAYRHRALATSRSYGAPPALETWSQLRGFFDAARRAGMVESMRDLHWDVRPRPGLGTVEVRVMDAQSTLREAVGFAAFVRALARYFRTTPPAERPVELPDVVPIWFERENHFQATRAGLEARYIGRDARVRPLRSVARALFDSALGASRRFGESEYLESVEELFDSPGHRRQLAVYEQTGSLCETVGVLVDILSR